jgi:stage III sporulation protein AA
LSECGRFDEAAKNLSCRLQGILEAVPDAIKNEAQEIRLGASRALSITMPGGSVFIGPGGAKTSYQSAYKVQSQDIEESVRRMTGNSVYSFQSSITSGFLTLNGGHRAGVFGSAVLEGGRIIGVRDISFINLRIAREIKGAASDILPYVFEGDTVHGCLIVSPPRGGKTTVLRDLARQLSIGAGGRRPLKVAVIDERAELAACLSGVPQNDMGPLTDVLDGYPKGQGMILALRSLSPEVMICDEMGSYDDIGAAAEALNCGVPVISTAHAQSMRELREREPMRKILKSGAISRVIFLEGAARPGKIKLVQEAGD